MSSRISRHISQSILKVDIFSFFHSKIFRQRIFMNNNFARKFISALVSIVDVL